MSVEEANLDEALCRRERPFRLSPRQGHDGCRGHADHLLTTAKTLQSNASCADASQDGAQNPW